MTFPLAAVSKASSHAPDPSDRIRLAREAMIRQIKDRFGGDPALLKASKT